MTADQLSELVSGTVVILALVFDLGLLSKKSTEISIKKALYQTLFWVSLAFLFGGFLWWEEGKATALEYVSAYLMEWSLSIDNIFVFILIFSFFNIKKEYYGQVLMLGILMAIVFRIIFIAIGIALVAKFGWILYVFGAFLVFTGVKMFIVEQDDEFDPRQNKVYMLLQKLIPITHEDA